MLYPDFGGLLGRQKGTASRTPTATDREEWNNALLFNCIPDLEEAR